MLNESVQPQMICEVCGENDFNLKAGFYYCNECGTKYENARDVEVERDKEFDDIKHRKVLKIRTEKSNKPELTSWECYNYILRGMVDELISMGAKDELKVMTLQVWAAYLRSMEVAFFSRKRAELPRLSLYFKQSDAVILYNHATKRKKKRQQASSIASGSKREWTKRKKQLDQSQYESSLSQSGLSSSFAESSGQSSTSGATNRAIRLNFSTRARKQLKKQMPIKHLEKHEQDFNRTLTCHALPAKLKDVNSIDRMLDLKMKQLYAIVAIALNLVEDDIQLCDLMRFAAEGHISWKNVEKFFPENLSEHCKEMMASLRFHVKGTHFPVNVIRLQASLLCKILHISSLKTPDIAKLVQRYVKEMYLPGEIFTFIERLINLCPPDMKWDHERHTPSYEGRAMAYIVFTLKLLFGLDGRKEKKISKSAKKVNELLASLEPEHQQLFIWDEWVEYIEMRKIVLCKHSVNACKQFQQAVPREMFLQQLKDRFKIAEKPLSEAMKKAQQNLEFVFEKFLHSIDEKPVPEPDPIVFSPSFTPSYNNLQRLQMDPKINATIPDFMQVDHSQRSLLPLLKPTQLKETFAKHGRRLSVAYIGCSHMRNYIGTFRSPGVGVNVAGCKANFDIEPGQWEANLKATRTFDTVFKPDMDEYTHGYCLSLMRKKNPILTGDTTIPDQTIPDNNSCMASIDLLDENDMSPADIKLTAPRRNLNRLNLFEGLDEHKAEHKEEYNCDETVSDDPTVKLKISNMDCWILMGKCFELTEAQLVEVKRKLPLSFFWLLETCANTLGIEWSELYDQVLTLETFFSYAIEPLNEFEDRIVFKGDTFVKDINQIVKHFKSHF